ncbi:hypothetical protein KXD40_007572 [Peronospora effusa]|uniref:Uncharacterized protein n=1 Tax=Peronospora effusa TaxID=542832 RepID=A0A425CJZ2_9STRA|nr:hypothetical protein DD237_001112 [Peronospora effusa]UIZ29189.1 hypothetical protein KXD40_007572 [Peronospora effusa]
MDSDQVDQKYYDFCKIKTCVAKIGKEANKVPSCVTKDGKDIKFLMQVLVGSCQVASESSE